MLGSWKSIDELEENLSLNELNMIVDRMRRNKHNEHKFTAMLKGVEYPDYDDSGEEVSTFEEIQERVQAKINAQNMGISEEAADFMSIGIGVIEE